MYLSGWALVYPTQSRGVGPQPWISQACSHMSATPTIKRLRQEMNILRTYSDTQGVDGQTGLRDTWDLVSKKTLFKGQNFNWAGILNNSNAYQRKSPSFEAVQWLCKMSAAGDSGWQIQGRLWTGILGDQCFKLSKITKWKSKENTEAVKRALQIDEL